MHKSQFDKLLAEATQAGDLEGVTLLGDPPPDIEEAIPKISNPYLPRPASKWEDLGLPQQFLYDMILRTIYNRGQLTGGEIAQDLRIPFNAISLVLQQMRKQTLIDIVAQRGASGDASFVYEIKPPKGTPRPGCARQDLVHRPGPDPVRGLRRGGRGSEHQEADRHPTSIQRAFEDLIISDDVFNEIGPAMNSGASIFFFGFPGNGKTSMAERITRLMGDSIYVPYAVEANGQIVKVFDPILHSEIKEGEVFGGTEGCSCGRPPTTRDSSRLNDQRSSSAASCPCRCST